MENKGCAAMLGGVVGAAVYSSLMAGLSHAEIKELIRVSYDMASKSYEADKAQADDGH